MVRISAGSGRRDRAGTGVRSRCRLRPYGEGFTADPVITLVAGDGPLAGRTLPPEYHAVLAPGYQHLDVLTAAPVQNTGRPEISTSLAGFALT